jgi:hypothetical protein
MTKRRLIGFAMGVCVLTLVPNAAFAQGDVIGWLSELSGPGSFRPDFVIGFGGVETNVLCFPRGAHKFSAAWKACQLNSGIDLESANTNNDVRWLVTFGYTQTKTKRTTDQPGLFKDDPNDDRDATERTFAVMFMYRANRIVDVGSGVEFLRFSAPAGTNAALYPSFGFWKRGLVPARMTVTPFGEFKPWKPRWRRVLHLQAEAIWIPEGFSGREDFRNPNTTFKSGPEFQVRTAAVIDFTPLYTAFRK